MKDEKSEPVENSEEKVEVELSSELEVQERIPEYELDEGVAELIKMIESRLGGSDPVVVGVAGGASSGKSSLVTKRLKEHFGNDLSVIPMDNYYYSAQYLEEQKELGNELSWHHPGSMDLGKLNNDVVKLKAGEEILIPDYDFVTSTPIPDKIEVKPNKIILVEGMFALSDEVKDVIDLHAFIDVGKHGRLIRQILRDISERGRSPKSIIKYFAEVGMEMHDKYIQPTLDNADLIIKNEYSAQNETEKLEDKEIQLKFSTELNKEAIIEAGAKFISEVDQVDTYLEATDRKFAESDESLRIRDEGDSKTLTYKGPKKNKSGFSERSKIEFKIDSETEKNLKELYSKGSIIIKKHRQIFEMYGIKFALDQVSYLTEGHYRRLGDFVQIWGEGDMDNLSDLMEKLYLNITSSRTDTYLSMAMKNEL